MKTLETNNIETEASLGEVSPGFYSLFIVAVGLEFPNTGTFSISINQNQDKNLLPSSELAVDSPCVGPGLLVESKLAVLVVSDTELIVSVSSPDTWTVKLYYSLVKN